MARALLLLLTVAAPATSAARRPAGLSRFSVVVGDDDPADDFAAHQLAIFLGIAAGTPPLPVVPSPGAPSAPVFIVGPAAAVAAGGLSVAELRGSGVK